MTQPNDEEMKIPKELLAHFNYGHVGAVVMGHVDAISSDIISTVGRINKIVPYLLGTYYTDSQRGIAERELFRLQTLLAEQYDEMMNTLAIAPDLNRPRLVAVQT